MGERVPEPAAKALTRKKAAPEKATPAPRGSEPSGGGGLLGLQRAAGNLAVVSMLAEQPVQAKLMVGPAGDQYEQEADQVADQVLRMLEGATDVLQTGAPPDELHRSVEEKESASTAAPADTPHDYDPAEDKDGEEAALGAASLSPATSSTGEDDKDTGSGGTPASASTAATAPASTGTSTTGEDTKDTASGATDAATVAAAAAMTSTPDDQKLTRVPARTVRRAMSAADADAAAASPGHGMAGGDVDEQVADQIEASRGRGQPLPEGLRQQMESGFGADFSGVRVHQDGAADALSRSLNAKAFTTGSDIFFSSGAKGDNRILAHELAHTVQQGSTVRMVRRFVSPSEFAAMTNQGTFVMKGTAQKKIEKYLGEYYALTGQKPTPAMYARPVIPDVKLRAALNLLELMHLTADGWLTAHSTKKDDGSRGDLEKNRAKRGAGMIAFDQEVQSEKARLEAQLATKAASEKTQDAAAIAATKFENRSDKIAKKFTGSMLEGFSLASTAIGAIVSHDGQSTDFTLDLTIPVGGPGYVSVTLEFNARKEGNVEVGLNLKVGGGVKFPNVADVRAALGGYIKASGKTPRAAVDLIKYGLYRRLRESSAVPRELANKIWGDDSGEAGYEQGEKWSRQVEESHLADDDSYVESGGSIGAKVHLGADAAGGGVEAEYQGGTRHDKQSVVAAKGALGAANTRKGGGAADGSQRGAQARTGRSVENIHLAGEINIGPFKGQLIVDWAYRAPDPVTKETDFSEIEFQLNARFSMPVGDLASTIVSLIGSLVTTVKGKAQTLAKEAERQAAIKAAGGKVKEKSTGDAVLGGLKNYGLPTILTGNKVANAVSFDQAGVPWTQWAQGITKEAAKAKAADPAALKILSKVGLEIGLRLKGDVDGHETGLLELRHVSDMDVGLPELLKVQLVRKTRLGAAKWNGSGWEASA
jgi:hypothetical protein